MKVKCIEKAVSLLPEKIKSNYSISDSEFSIAIGKEYLVYAMTVHYGYVWYYICDESCSYYPIWNPSSFFQVVDGSLSRHWIYSLKEGERATLRPRWAFREWAEDPDYYDKLTDGEEKEVAIFKAYKTLMDMEFPDSSVIRVAQVGDQEWLICPECMDAWSSSGNRDGMVVCPKCNTIMHNPRYRGLN
jgi:hypothetical protein